MLKRLPLLCLIFLAAAELNVAANGIQHAEPDTILRGPEAARSRRYSPTDRRGAGAKGERIETKSPRN